MSRAQPLSVEKLVDAEPDLGRLSWVTVSSDQLWVTLRASVVAPLLCESSRRLAASMVAFGWDQVETEGLDEGLVGRVAVDEQFVVVAITAGGALPRRASPCR
jgi:hypothetical protein